MPSRGSSGRHRGHVTPHHEARAQAAREVIRAAAPTVRLTSSIVLPPLCFADACGKSAAFATRLIPRRNRESTVTLGESGEAWREFFESVLLALVVTVRDSRQVWRGQRALRRLLVERREVHKRHQDPAAEKGEVFLSYKSGEHEAYVEALAGALERNGFGVWLDTDRGTLPTNLMFLDRILEDAIRDARAVVTFTARRDLIPVVAAEEPQDVRYASVLRWIVWVLTLVYVAANSYDVVDRQRVQLQFALRRTAPPELRKWWYQHLCGVGLDRRRGERWQEWECRLAVAYGTPVIRVAIGDGESPVPTAPELVLLRRSRLQEDMETRLVDRVMATERDRCAPIPLGVARARASVRAHTDHARAHPFLCLLAATRLIGQLARGEAQLSELVRSLAQRAPSDTGAATSDMG